MTVAKKADSLYKTVSAASIAAKVRAHPGLPFHELAILGPAHTSLALSMTCRSLCHMDYRYQEIRSSQHGLGKKALSRAYRQTSAQVIHLTPRHLM